MKSLKRSLLIAVLFISSIKGIAQNQNALHFDGVNDYVQLPVMTHNNMVTVGTLEGWIKTSNAGSGYRGLIVREAYYGLFLNNNQLMTYNWTTGTISGTSYPPTAHTYTLANLNDNQWHHVALTFHLNTANGAQLYLDGQPVGPAISLFYTGTQTSSFRLGTNGSQPALYQGGMDDVKIYNRILTPTEINTSYNCGTVSSSGLQASYDFNQGLSGGNTLVSGTTSNTNGTLSNFALSGTTSNWVDGKLCCFSSTNITGTASYCAGQTINLTAAFTTKPGESITSYQWKKNGVNLNNGGNVSGATSANLQIANIVLADLGNYSVEVTSTCGTISYAVNISESGSINISNLTAHYAFNNSSAVDISGNNYNATASNITSTVNRLNQANTAFSFNGTNSSVTIAAPTGQTILGNGQNKSISLWFKRSSTASKGMLLGYQQATPGSWNPLAYIGNDGILRGWMYQGGTTTWSSGVIIDTNWHHLALVYTTNLQTVYLDGSQVTTLSGTLSPGAASNIIMIGNGYANTGITGVSVTGNQPFSGTIDEVRFYNSVLSSADVNTLAANPFLITNQPQGACTQIASQATLTITVLGSVNYQWQKNGINIPGATSSTYNINNIQQSDFGLYRCVVTSQCDNAISSISNEVSIGLPVSTPQPSRVYTFNNNYDDRLLKGTLHSLPTITTNDPSTFVADRFGTANSALNRGTWACVRFNKEIKESNSTISMWVNLNNTTGTHVFLAPFNNNLPYHLFAENRQLKIRPTSGITNDIIIPYFLPATGWVQITMVYQGSTNIVYINGQHVFTTTNGINLSTYSIGSTAGLPGQANTAKYSIDDLRVFEQAFSPSEVLGLYATGEEVPYFFLEPINAPACSSNEIRFDFIPGISNCQVSIKKNGVDLPAGGNVAITQNSVVISNPGAGDFTNYTITLRNGCGSVSKTVNAVQLASGFATQGLVRFFSFNNNLNDALGGPALSVGGGINYVSDRFSNANAACQQMSGNTLFLPTAAIVNSNPYTVSFWVNNYPTTSTNQMLSSGQITSTGLTAENQYLGFSMMGNITGFKEHSVFTGGWRMLTLTFDGQIAKIYSNNQLISTHRPLSSTTYLQTFINQLPCEIDDIRIYNRVLADEEVRGLYGISSISTQPQNQSVCTGQTANLSVNAQSTLGNTLTYQWTYNGNPLSNGGSISGATTNNLQISNAQISNGGTYNCIVNSGCNETSTNSVTLTVGAGNVNITQQPQNSSVCQGNSASFSIATQGATVTYQWKKNGVNIGGATNATLNLTNVNSLDAGNYTVDIIGGSCGTIISQVATLTVQSIPTATITPASPTICQGQSINLTAGGGTSFSWDNGLGTGNIKTVTPTTTTTYSVVVAGSNGCTATASQTVTVVNTPTPTGIANQTFCNSAIVTNLTASGTGIQWYTTSNGGSALSAGTALTNGNTYYATQTVSTCESVNRLAVVATINTPNAPTGVSNQTVCSGAVLGDLSVTGLIIQWYTAANGGSPIASSTVLNNGTTYYATQTINGCESLPRLAINVAFGIPNAPTGSASQTFCNSGSVSNLTATGTNIHWYNTSSGGTPLATSTSLVNGNTYYATQTISGCESTNRFAVSVTINVPAAPTGSATQEFCNSATVADLTPVGSGIQWYTSSTGGSTLASTTALGNGTYYASQTTSGCESANRFVVAVTINVPAAPAGNSNQILCGSGLVSDINANGVNLTWYDAATAGNVVAPTTALVDGSSYYATQTINGCTSLNQLMVNVSINQIPAAPTGATNQSFCNSAIISDLVVNGTSVNWYASALGSIPLTSTTALSNGSTYYVTQTIAGCESTNRFAVTVAINAPTAPSGNTTQSFCSAATINDLVVTGTSIAWYSTSTGGTPLTGSFALANGTYYASQTINSCESANRLAISVSITIPNASVTQSGITLTATQSGANYSWVDCNNGNQPIIGANGQSFTPTANGNYAVEIDLNNCSVMSSCVQITSVGLEDDKLDLLTIQPNPTNGILTITVSHPTTVVVSSSNGSEIATLKIKSETILDVTNYATGVYYLRSSEGQTMKFIKQ